MLRHIAPFFMAAEAPPGPVDQPGTLRVSAVAGGRRNQGAEVTGSVTDPDGIASITSTMLNARDGSTQTIAYARRDANTFNFSQTYNNARWRTARLDVVYVETGGASRMLSANYSV